MVGDCLFVVVGVWFVIWFVISCVVFVCVVFFGGLYCYMLVRVACWLVGSACWCGFDCVLCLGVVGLIFFDLIDGIVALLVVGVSCLILVVSWVLRIV